MSAAYTAETVSRIRLYARKGWPPGATALMLGWEMSRLQRIAAHHGIAFPVPETRHREPTAYQSIRWDGTHAWYRFRSVKLMPAEGRIFEVLARSPDYPWTAEKLWHRCGVSKNSIPVRLTHLRRKLRSIGLKLTTKRPYHLEGA
jgi:DNA-binding response OmpR family regulator